MTSMNKIIWVVGVKKESSNMDYILQLVGKARELALKDERVVTVLNFTLNELEKKDLYRCGTDKILAVKTDMMESYVDYVENLLKEQPSKIVILPSNQYGKEIASTLATRLSAGLTADCIGVDLEDGKLTYTRAAINSSVIAKIQCINTELEMCTVRKNVFPITFREQTEGQYEEVVYESEKSSRNDITVLESIKDTVQKIVAIEKASIVFGVGRGASDEKTLSLVNKIAQRLGAAVVGTRVVVEEGIFTREFQVGQSGITICPKVYIALGISGAIQHIVGMKDSLLIIAINKDAGAPIFQYADYCIVDECYSILEQMYNRI